MKNFILLISFLCFFSTLFSQNCISDKYNFLKGEWIVTDSLKNVVYKSLFTLEDCNINEVHYSMQHVSLQSGSKLHHNAEKNTYTYFEYSSDSIFSQYTVSKINDSILTYTSTQSQPIKNKITWLPINENLFLKIIDTKDDASKAREVIYYYRNMNYRVQDDNIYYEPEELVHYSCEFIENTDQLDLNKSMPYLENAAYILNKYSDGKKIAILNHTQTKHGKKRDLELSKLRAIAVKNKLIELGVDAEILVPIGRGSSDLKYPECDEIDKCPTWKIEENNRTYIDFYSNIKDSIDISQFIFPNSLQESEYQNTLYLPKFEVEKKNVWKEFSFNALGMVVDRLIYKKP